MQMKRREEIAFFVQEHGSASLDELCQKFQVSKNTIRRDVQELTDTNQLKKVYGGVVAIKNQLISFENRSIKKIDEKSIIGEKAARFIKNQDLVFIDSGTTTKMMMPFIPTDISFTLLTNNLDVINSAANRQNIQLILVGNTFKYKTRSFVGINERNILKEYNINKAFMAATGVTIENGLTNSDFLEYEIKKNACGKAGQIFLLADHSKFGQATLMTYAPLADVDYVITDQKLDISYQNFCNEQHIVLC